MMLPFLQCPPAGGCGDPGTKIAWSARFAGSQDIKRALSGAADRKLSFVDLWVQRSKLGAQQALLNVWSGVNNTTWLFLGFDADDTLSIREFDGTSTMFYRRKTKNIYRDLARLLHVRVEFRTGDAVAGNRLVLKVNGSVPTFQTGNDGYPMFIDPSLNYQTAFGSTLSHAIGAWTDGSQRFEGHMARVAIGVGAVAVDWGYFNRDGHWVPGPVVWPAAATQGGLLEFGNGSNFGIDTSPNAANWTATGFAASNQSTNTPSNVECVLDGGNKSSGETVSAGGISGTNPNTNTVTPVFFTQPLPTRGKWRFRARQSSWNGTATISPGIGQIGGGVRAAQSRNDATWASQLGGGAAEIAYDRAGFIRRAGATVATVATHGVGDYIDVGYDSDAQIAYFWKNGALIWSGAHAWPAGVQLAFCCDMDGTFTAEFGDVLSPAAPTGFSPLNSATMPCPAILRPDQFFTVRQRSGGAGVTDLPWNPTVEKTLVLSKRTDTAADWRAVDTVRGAGVAWSPNALGAGQIAEATGLSAFTATGYSVGAATPWQGTRSDAIWRASRTSGFDIVGTIAHTTGTASTRTHAAGAAIDYAWVVRLDAAQDHRVFHRALAAGQYLRLNSTVAPTTDANWFGSTANDLTLGASLPTGTYIVYAWRTVPQFSAFLGYTGSGSASDGAMILADFTPRRLDTHRIDTASNWYSLDLDRSPENPVASQLNFETSAAASAGAVDFLSNGAKLRNADGSQNASGGTYMSAMWAQAPGKFGNGR